MKISIECLLMRGKPESTNTHRNQEKEFSNCLPDVNFKTRWAHYFILFTMPDCLSTYFTQ